MMSFETLKGSERPRFRFLFEFYREGESTIRQSLLLQIGADGGLSGFLLKAVPASGDPGQPSAAWARRGGGSGGWISVSLND